jgi:hypothetical protein
MSHSCKKIIQLKPFILSLKMAGLMKNVPQIGASFTAKYQTF